VLLLPANVTVGFGENEACDVEVTMPRGYDVTGGFLHGLEVGLQVVD
jgi:hypothetical protein